MNKLGHIDTFDDSGTNSIGYRSLGGTLAAYADFSNILKLSSTNNSEKKDSQLWFYVNIILTAIAVILFVYFINYMRKQASKKKKSIVSFGKRQPDLFGS